MQNPNAIPIRDKLSVTNNCRVCTDHWNGLVTRIISVTSNNREDDHQIMITMGNSRVNFTKLPPLTFNK